MKEITKEELEDLIFNKKKTYAEIGDFLGISGGGARRRALRMGIKLPKKRAINESEKFNKGVHRTEGSICPVCGVVFFEKPSGKFCTKECFMKSTVINKEKKYKEYVLNNGENVPQRPNYKISWIKDFVLEEQNNKCCLCGVENTWNNKKLIFILDHIDGNAANNKKDNLRLVCPNCDSQLETYKSKNKNGARHYYRYNKLNGAVSHSTSNRALTE